jgi:hypothetical protein
MFILETIGIVVKVREGCGFGTDILEAERIILVAADRPDMLTRRVDKYAARRFAERAGRGLDPTNLKPFPPAIAERCEPPSRTSGSWS